MFTIDFFTVTGINNTTCSKYRIGNRKFNSKLAIVIFQITSISFKHKGLFTLNVFKPVLLKRPLFI